jgi:hypothetical protein
MMRWNPERLIGRLWHSAYLDPLIGALEELRAWAVAGAFTLITIVTVGGAGETGARQPFRITATDAAGVFTLDILRGGVMGATVDGQVLPQSRIVQRGRQLLLKGADWANDLEIETTPVGGIRWQRRGPAPAAVAQEFPIELRWARAYFAEVDSVSRADGGRLWGVRMAGPMLFVARASRTVVANVPDSAGILTEREGVWVGTLPENVGIANTAVEWAGRRWTMVMWPVPSQGYARRRLLLHESFHRIQPLIGLAMGNPSNAHMASRDGRIYTRLEWRALAEALIRTGDARIRAIEDALSFRARRYALFSTAAAAEHALERNEGLAEYTGFRLSGLPEAARAVAEADALMDREGAANFARSFAYASGPAYGSLLDAADPEWRTRLKGGDGLEELLRAAYGLPRPDGKDVDERASRYDGARVIAEETRTAERAAAEQARLRAMFLEGPTLTLPVGESFGYSFNPNGAVPLEGQGTVYRTAEVRDDWGKLTVESGGVLLKLADGLITGVVVPVPPGSETAPTSGEGWRLDLADGWAVRPGTRDGNWVVVHHP